MSSSNILYANILQDMWDVLKDYPAARVRLEAIAVKRLEKYRKEPLKKSKPGHCLEIQTFFR